MSPNRRGTPPVTFRLDPKLKARAMAKASERGETLTDVFVRAAVDYVTDQYTDADRRDGIWTMTNTEFYAELANAWDGGAQFMAAQGRIAPDLGANPYRKRAVREYVEEER